HPVDALGCELGFREGMSGALVDAGLDAEPARVDVLLIRGPFATQAVHDPAVGQELTEAALVGVEQLADLPESLEAGAVDVSVYELDLGGCNGERLVCCFAQLVLFGPGAG